MSKMVTLTIDGKTAQVPEGTLIVNAAKQVGIDIPVFCYHPKMEPVGMCRMCLVEIGRPVIDRATGQPALNEDGSVKIAFGPKLDTACTVPVSEGMVVVGLSEKVQAARREVLEFLLTSHPLDCPVCDKGGECPLQTLTMRHGPGESRFLYDEKKHLAKHVALGDLIYLDRERCIQCGRCVRFQSEVVDDPVIGFYHRGRSLEIVTFSDPGFDSYFSGNTTDICPVGALTTEDFRFGARPWELKPAASICAQCPVGCNVVYNVRREARSGGEIVIKRALPRQNEAVNEIWICDKGRFTYHYTEGTPEQPRLTEPLVRRAGQLVPVSWEEALDVAGQRFKAAGPGLLTLASGRLANEDLANLNTLATQAGGKAVLYSQMAGGDLVAQVGLGKGSNFSDMGPESAILVVASDLEEEAPIWWLRVKQAAERGATLIVANPRATKLERYARHVLRYAYGSEAEVVMALGKALGNKIPSKKAELPGHAALTGDLRAAAEAFAKAENGVVIYGSEGLALEGSQGLAQACANLLVSTNHAGRPNNGLLAVWRRANDQGAWEVGLRPAADLAVKLQEAKAIYMAAADPAADDPALAAALAQAREQGAFMVVQELYLTETAKLADVVLPAQAYTERDGSYTSGERRVQRFYPAVLPKGGTRADYAITGQIGERMGLEMEAGSPARILQRTAAFAELGSSPYRKLAETEEQWPMVGRSNMFYGGAGYENRQGLGVQLTPAAQQGKLPALAWPETVAALPAAGAAGLVAVPVTVLYDEGQTVRPSRLLQARIPALFVVLHPEDAGRFNLRAGMMAQVSLGAGQEFKAVVRIDPSMPAGFLLAPRSLGVPLEAPTPVSRLRAAEPVKAHG